MDFYRTTTNDEETISQKVSISQNNLLNLQLLAEEKYRWHKKAFSAEVPICKNPARFRRGRSDYMLTFVFRIFPMVRDHVSYVSEPIWETRRGILFLLVPFFEGSLAGNVGWMESFLFIPTYLQIVDVRLQVSRLSCFMSNL